MKKFLQFVCVLLMMGTARAVPTLVQITNTEASTSSLTATLGSNTTVGNTIVAIVVNFNATSVTSVVDSNASGLSLAVTQNTQTMASIYYENVTVGGVNSVTANMTFASAGMVLAEYSGVATSPLDGTAANDNGFSPGSTSVTSNNSATLATTGELAIGAIVQWRSGSFTSAAGSGWTSQAVTTSGNIRMMDQTLSSTTALAATGTVSPALNSQTYVVLATFKPFVITPAPNVHLRGTVKFRGQVKI